MNKSRQHAYKETSKETRLVRTDPVTMHIRNKAGKNGSRQRPLYRYAIVVVVVVMGVVVRMGDKR